MADQYIKFILKPNQSAPDDGYATGFCLFDGTTLDVYDDGEYSSEYLVWKGPEGTFPTNDPNANIPYVKSVMTQDEIDSFES